ncbi:phospholipase D-like domain-containing protein [Geomonas ferrireducens]|nr:phospholipase D-like domain-containing protein [Geomonas ferrireducens]
MHIYMPGFRAPFEPRFRMREFARRIRHNYSELLKAGVRLYEHGSSIQHAKTAVIDGMWSTVGSTNLDYLSMLSNRMGEWFVNLFLRWL